MLLCWFCQREAIPQPFTVVVLGPRRGCIGLIPEVALGSYPTFLSKHREELLSKYEDLCGTAVVQLYELLIHIFSSVEGAWLDGRGI